MTAEIPQKLHLHKKSKTLELRYAGDIYPKRMEFRGGVERSKPQEHSISYETGARSDDNKPLISSAQGIFTLTAEFLRVHSPSAEVKGHGKPILQTGKQQVGIQQIVQVGTYAIRIDFDDGHNTGLYTWDYLWHLCQHQAQLWQDYLDALAAAGKFRDPLVQGVQLKNL